MQRKYQLEPIASSQLLLLMRLRPLLPAAPTKSGRAGIGEIDTETVPKGKLQVVASRKRNRKPAGNRQFQSRIQTW